MSPILGIYASANQLQYSTAFDSIASVTVGAGGVNTYTFSSIPQTYKHLQIRWTSRSVGSGQANGDTFVMYCTPHANNAYYHNLIGNGSSASASDSGGVSFSTLIGWCTKSTNTSGNFAVGVTDILDYTNTNKNKTIRSLAGWDDNGSGVVGLYSGMNNDTSAITSLTFLMNSGQNIAQGSVISLYGIKG